MIRRPPRSTPFPTRRSSDLYEPADRFVLARVPEDQLRNRQAYEFFKQLEAARSEEHTSELQSRLHLVCRLLLEKKKLPARAMQAQCSPDNTLNPPSVTS